MSEARGVGRWFTRALAGALLVGALTPAATGAERKAGEVLFVKGVTSAQRPDGAIRLMGKGDTLLESDVLTTGRRSYALVKLLDGARLTLRPQTTIALEEYVQTAERASTLLRLFKGGVRAITGLVARRRPDAFRLATPLATIGIRGTEFDARLCQGAECAGESRDLRRVQGASRATVIGRVAVLRGVLGATRWDGRQRNVVRGGPVFQAETLVTGPNAIAVVAFRDGTKVSLRPNTRFAVEHFDYAAADASRGSVLFRLLKGGFRAASGLVARRRPRFFNVVTPMATIGIRGTGFDAYCDGECASASLAPELTEAHVANLVSNAAASPAPGPGVSCRASDDLFVSVWEGAVGVGLQSGVFAVQAGETACLEPGATEPVLLPDTPQFIRDEPAPRPDGIDVDADALFAAQARPDDPPGLYVSVRQGHVALISPDDLLDLGDGETGFVDPATGELVRFVETPIFIEQDPYPRPGQVQPESLRVLDLIDEALRAPGLSPLQCTM